MRKKLQSEIIFFLNQIPDLSIGEFYFMLASMLIYFEPHIRQQTWNTFAFQIEKQQIPLQSALFMTDEEKLPYLFSNPKIPKKNKLEVLNYLYEQQRDLKEKLEQKKIWEHSRVQLAFISDESDDEAPAIFPIAHLKQKFSEGDFINELSGIPFPQETIDAVLKNKHSKISCKLSPSTVTAVPNNQFLKILGKELVRLDKVTKECWVCHKKETRFKTLRGHRMIRFCSLKCLEDYEHPNSLS